MPSSKKKRGKQRKAASAAAAARKERKSSVSRYIESLRILPADAVVEAIANREEVPTRAANDFFTQIAGRRHFGADVSSGDSAIYDQLIGAGIVSTLIRLANEGFVEDCQETGPSLHLRFLSNIAAGNDASRLQIASRIGPAVTCMINDREPNAWWYYSLRDFVYLIFNLSVSGENKKQVLGTLLEYEGLFEFMVWAMFYGIHRPDIVKGWMIFPSDSSSDPNEHFFRISCAAAKFTELVCEQHSYQSEDGKKQLHDIATMSAVSEACGTKSSLILIFGVLNLLKRHADYPMDNSNEEKMPFYSILMCLIKADCIDKELVANMIELGFNSTQHYADASAVTQLTSGILIPYAGEKVLLNQPNDQWFAIAISCGLFEMLLSLTLRFGSRNGGNGTADEGDLPYFVQKILEGAKNVVFRGKSAKSLANRREKILCTFDEHKDSVPQNEICKDIFGKLQSIASLASEGQPNISFKARCKTCGEMLIHAIKRCSKCGTAYCSRECQLEDWRNGDHKKVCKILSETKGRKGSLSKAQKEELSLHSNMNTVGGKTFFSNITRFLAQAHFMGRDLSELVAVMDFRSVPPMRYVVTFDDFMARHFSEDDDTEWVFRTREKQEGLLATACVTHDHEEDGKSRIAMGYPQIPLHDWQSAFKKQYGNISDDPAIRKELLTKINEANSDEDIRKILDTYG